MRLPDTDNLTEREIIQALIEAFRLAAEDCERLAAGERGSIYLQFRRRLREAEKYCRVVGGWRSDSRWLPLGMKIAEVQQQCGAWLRQRAPGWRFAGLASILRRGQHSAQRLAHARTGTRQPILPPTAPAYWDAKQGRSVSMSGLILPPGYVNGGGTSQ